MSYLEKDTTNTRDISKYEGQKITGKTGTVRTVYDCTVFNCLTV